MERFDFPPTFAPQLPAKKIFRESLELAVFWLRTAFHQEDQENHRSQKSQACICYQRVLKILDCLALSPLSTEYSLNTMSLSEILGLVIKMLRKRLFLLDLSATTLEIGKERPLPFPVSFKSSAKETTRKESFKGALPALLSPSH